MTAPAATPPPDWWNGGASPEAIRETAGRLLAFVSKHAWHTPEEMLLLHDVHVLQANATYGPAAASAPPTTGEPVRCVKCGRTAQAGEENVLVKEGWGGQWHCDVGHGCTVASPPSPALADAWLLWSDYHHAWWGPDRSGYCPDILGAGIYTREEAEAVCEDTEPDRARAKSLQSHWDGMVERPGTVIASLLTALRSSASVHEVHLRRHTRLAEALGMDPGYSADATVNEAIRRASALAEAERLSGQLVELLSVSPPPRESLTRREDADHAWRETVREVILPVAQRLRAALAPGQPTSEVARA